MFARRSKLLVSRGALATVAAITLIIGSACKDPIDCLCDSLYRFAGLARGARVVPPATDTMPEAVVTFNAPSLAYRYSVTSQPAGTIDSIALYQVAPPDPLPASATAILCAGAAVCASATGTASIVAPATLATITTSIRAYRTQLVIFTTTAQKAVGGAMRGTMYAY